MINKSPVKTKTLLYQTEMLEDSWDNFVQIAEEISCIGYPDKIVSSIEKYIRPEQYNRMQERKRA